MEKILISACLVGDNVKYNGGNNLTPKLDALLEKYELIPFCFFVEGGLSTRITQNNLRKYEPGYNDNKIAMVGAPAGEEDLPDAAFVELEDGDIPYNFPVTMASTYGNSIYPGNYIDVYMKAFNENGELMVGKLIENVKVLAVKNSSGQNVFENSEETRTPAYMIFGLDYELNILLRKASYMSEFSVDLFPVPHGTAVKASEGETAVSSQTLKDFINANTVPNDEITAQQEAEAAKDSAADNTKNTKKES